MKSIAHGFGPLAYALLFFALLPQGQPQQTPPNDPPPAAKTITGSGCVEAGVEAGCTVLKDAKTKILYNLYFSGKKPTIGTGIRFEGSKHDGATICMQGEAVKVSRWRATEMSCAAPKDNPE